jgi:hypothetical protein
MKDPLQYEVTVEASHLDTYRHTYSPKPGFVLAAMWPTAYVIGKSGKRYFGLRGIGDYVKGLTHPFVFKELSARSLDKPSPDLYSEFGVGGIQLQFEPFEYIEKPDEVRYRSRSMTYQYRDNECDWIDAKGQWTIHGRRIGKACYIYIPSQDGIDFPTIYRSEIGKATGVINGDPVEGFFHCDFAYAPPGYYYWDSAFIRKVEKYFLSWIVEYADGGFGGGMLWQGRDGFPDFQPCHLNLNGESSAHKGFALTTTLSPGGALKHVKIEIGGASFEFEQEVSSIFWFRDTPVHTHGALTASTENRKIAKSWTFFEQLPLGEDWEIGLSQNDKYLRLARGR